MYSELMLFKKDISILGLFSFYYYEHSKNFYFAGERHDYWEMVYVDSGEISVIADTTGYTIRQGEIIFHKPMEFHTLASNKKDPHNVIVLSFLTRSSAMSFFENKIFEISREQKRLLALLTDEINKTFGTIADIIPKKDLLNRKSNVIGSQQLIISYLEQFLISLIRSNQGNERSKRKSRHAKKNAENALITSIEQYLADNIYGSVTLDDVCRVFHVSKSHLCAVFKEATGKSVIDCYIRLKIVEAKKLIRDGNLNYTQIAEALCYSGIHHFTRSFKKNTGQSPSVYEKSIK